MDIFKSLLKAEQAEQLTSDLQGRAFGVSIAVVADIADPATLGRIRVLLASNGAKTMSDWLVRLTMSKHVSPPLVDVGDTVAISFINGDPKNGVYLGTINNLPQPPALAIESMVTGLGASYNVQNEDSVTIGLGGNAININRDRIHLVAGQANLYLKPNGTLEITGLSSATINGKEIMLVGGKDSRNDTMTNSGI